jgi:hypothetical protein
MTSKRKFASNRSNARHSTGPRTPAGKDRVSRNALRHGLAVNILKDPTLSMEVERLADAIAGRNASPYRVLCAQVIAEAELELMRIRGVKAALIGLAATHRIDLSAPAGIDGSQVPQDGAMPNSAASIPSQMFQADAFLLALPQIVRLERYERRAFSQCQRAIRRLDQP